MHGRESDARGDADEGEHRPIAPVVVGCHLHDGSDQQTLHSPDEGRGAKPRSATSAEGRRLVSARADTAWNATNEANPPNHSTAMASSGTAATPKSESLTPVAETGSATTSARLAACASV